MTTLLYEYRAKIIAVVDGDTVHADVDLGFDHHQLMTLRLAGINAPEMSTVVGDRGTLRHPGIDARDHLIELVGSGPVTIRTQKDRREKYGRYLATLYVDGVDLNKLMVTKGHAVPYDGGKR